ncbi:MAG: DUF418 domain-containing protein [Gammaproteobacteria bacterium]
MTSQPIEPSERIQSLDVIRGFALLGILLMNIEYFQKPMQAVVFGLDMTQTGIDYAVALFVYVFVQGKFYTMFSLLFGIGFVIFLDRALARGVAPRVLFARRLFGLVLIGAAHAFLVWSGDILLMYGLVGLLLLLFAKTPAKRLWKWGLAFLIFPAALMWLGAVGIELAMNSPKGPEMVAEFEATRASITADIAHGHVVYGSGTYLEAVSWRIHEWTTLYGGGGWLFFSTSILGLFLIGASFGRAGVFAAPAASAPLFRRLALFGFLIGLPAALYVGMNAGAVEMMYPTIAGAKVFSAATVANLALCLAYVASLALLLQRAAPARVLSRLAPAGRMALTNYLTHSVVFTLLFYGYGLGLYGEYGRAATTVMALVLFAAQVWFSGWWLDRHRIGPMEWLWRTMTYGRLQPLRLSPAL